MAMHYIDSDIAVKVGGLNEAVIFQDFLLEIKYLEDNGLELHDEEYWSRTSVKELAEYFTYFSLDQIRIVLRKLIARGFLKSRNYNANPIDRTLWYTFGEAGKPIYEEWKKSRVRIIRSRRHANEK